MLINILSYSIQIENLHGEAPLWVILLPKTSAISFVMNDAKLI